jgi:hypothetical protein
MAAAELLNETPEQRLEHEVLEWTESVYDEAERELSDSKELKLTGKLIDYIEGRQWSPQARFGRSRPVENRFVRQFIEMVGQLTDILPDFKVTFHDHPEGFSELESLLNQYISLWAENTDFEGDLSQTVIYGLLHTGYGKVQWNPALANGYGDNEYIPVSPINLMEVGTDNKLKEAECVIYRVPVTLQYLKRKYGKIADFIKPDTNMQNQPAQMMRPAKMSASQWSKLPKSLQNMLGQKKDGMIGTKYPIALMKEFWFKDDCIAPNTKILTADLKWKKASEIKVGDELIGCDEEPSTAKKNKCRWLRKVKVEKAYPLVRPSVRIVTDKGVVECSESHRWLATDHRNNRFSWMFAGEIKPGDKIAYTFAPWKEDDSRGAGYLAGIFDGEGWSTKYGIGFGQGEHNSIVMKAASEILAEKGFDFNIQTAKKLWRNQKSPTLSLNLKGGRAEFLRLIGQIRPPRLLATSEKLWVGKLLNNKGEKSATVLSVEKIGDAEVIALKTDHQTFIADGFVSHNCTNETSTTFRVGPENANWSYIVEPGMPIYPRGRLVVTAGRKVLADSCNPYWHASHPFGKYRPYRMPWTRFGLSALEPGAAIQNILNRINGGVMDTVNAAIEPTLIAPKAAFSDQSWDTMDPGAPGGKLRYNNNTPKVPEFRKPPELASYVLAVKQGLEKEQDMSSGSAAIQQSLQKKQVPSGDSLDMILNSKSVNVRLMGKNLKSYLTDIGSMVACNTMQFASVKRRAQLFGGTGILDSDFTPRYGEMKPAGMEPEEFVRSMSFSIRKLNMAAERSEDLTIAFGLRKNKDLSRKRLLLKLDPNFDTKQNDEELLAEALQQASVQGLVGAAGGGHHGGKK